MAPRPSITRTFDPREGEALSLRRLHPGHFAFMRAVVQGVDERVSWERYLRVAGEPTDLRTIRRTVAWIRDAFAAAAYREQRPGTARLILINPETTSAAPPGSTEASRAHVPTLEEFALAQGLEDFSQDEQIEAYKEAYPPRAAAASATAVAARRAQSRRARLIARQLDALRWLEQRVAQAPRAIDPIEAWLAPAMARRLRSAGIITLENLVAQINARGARWWRDIAGIGQGKAARIQDWLRVHQQTIGVHQGDHAWRPRRQLSDADFAAVVPRGSALLPYEKFEIPPTLEGQGRTGCSDREALDAWIGTPGAQGRAPATVRGYRKEAERLLLWAVLERRKPLSQLDHFDARAYIEFLAAPPAHWCGPRHHQRWSPLWRPLEAGLGQGALAQARAVARVLFSHWVAVGHVVANPFDGVATSEAATQSPAPERSPVQAAHWEAIEVALARRAEGPRTQRLQLAMAWLRHGTLRPTQLLRAVCGDLSAVPGRDQAWQVLVRRRGRPSQAMPLASPLIALLPPQPAAPERPLLSSGQHAREEGAGWRTPSGLYKAVKALLVEAAALVPPSHAGALRAASPSRLTAARRSRDERQGRVAWTRIAPVLT
ncbi:site-specific recombinase XerC [Variovorax boronicumulans]|uniref:phage integrase family protein n=1 Tax=Variovorax boronicumulans TaxID=436515 RepID=UPI00339A8212